MGLQQLELKNIRITDSLFGGYVKKVADVMIPYQWKKLTTESSDRASCIRNFQIAAGELKGERKGVVFLDTDLYKWLEAVAYCLEAGYGKENMKYAEKAIDLIGRAQEADGYLNTYYTVNAPDRKWTNLVEGHELYTCGHFYEAAAAYHQATGNEAILNIAKKNADHVCSIFGKGKGQIAGYPGHPEVEVGLIKLYRATGDRKYLEQAKYFVSERGGTPNYLMEEIKKRGGYDFFSDLAEFDDKYFVADKPPLMQTKAEGHAVRAMYLFSAMADLAEEYRDQEMMKACRRLWENTVSRRMYITGSIGSSGIGERFTTDYDLPNTTNYSETCASVGLMMFGQRMASATGNAGYYDIVELALYNTILGSINTEGNRYFYVNPLEVVPEFCTDHTYMKHVKPVRQKWFGCACCPPNAARTIASVGQYIYASDPNGTLYIHEFISSEAKLEKSGKSYLLKMESDFLRSGRLTITCTSSGNGKLKIRIPSYAEGWELKVNGAGSTPAVRNSYITVSLRDGENRLELSFRIVPHWMAANNSVRADAGRVALKKGPLVYCLEEADNGKMLSEIYVKENEPVREGKPIRNLPGEIPVLEFGGVQVGSGVPDSRLYGEFKGARKKPKKCRAIPYFQWQNRGEGEMSVWQKILF
jgi:DUF1680 family protein